LKNRKKNSLLFHRFVDPYCSRPFEVLAPPTSPRKRGVSNDAIPLSFFFVVVDDDNDGDDDNGNVDAFETFLVEVSIRSNRTLEQTLS